MLKEIYRWHISILKDAPHQMSLGNCKLKQWDTTTHLLESLDQTHWPPNAGRDVEQQEPSLLVGMQNGTVTLENSLAVFNKMKHNFTIRSDKHIPLYLSKSVDSFYVAQNCCTEICIAALLIISEMQKQPRCLSAVERINGGASRQWNIIQL